MSSSITSKYPQPAHNTASHHKVSSFFLNKNIIAAVNLSTQFPWIQPTQHHFIKWATYRTIRQHWYATQACDVIALFTHSHCLFLLSSHLWIPL